MGMFDGMMGGGQQDSAISVLKDLLDDSNIEMKTDLNINQIKVLFQLELDRLITEKVTKADVTDKSKWTDNDIGKDKYTAREARQLALVYYLKLMVSAGRQSRKEITDAVREMKDSMIQETLAMAGLMGGGKK